MKISKLIVKTKSQKYPILIGENLISKFSKIFKEEKINFSKCLVVIDQNIPNKIVKNLKKKLSGEKFFFYYFKSSEKNKNQKSVDKIIKILLDKNFSRKDCLISIGGGITGDVCGFSASIFKRGLKFINIPTTLLAQVDSSIGGKTGVNTIHGKNLIGSFYQPKLVISDTIFLRSLPKREILCGYGEILKHSLILKPNFFNFLKKNFLKIINLKSPFIEKSIYESCKIKKSIVEKDEKENNLRKSLNFGHTFAHAYEATTGYNQKLNHGEAVLLGMNTALKFSKKNKILKQNRFSQINDHFEKSKLPNNLKKYFSTKDIDKILSFMIKDKKNDSSQINLILLKDIGRTIINKKYNQSKIKSFLRNELVY